MDKYTRLVTPPHLSSVNEGVEPCPTTLLATRYGLPAKSLPENCGGISDVTSQFWRVRMRTEDVGPFKATGYVWALELLRRGLADLKKANAELYGLLGSAGMLCVRHVRGRPGVPSNHCFGMAIDLTIAGRLDPYDDDRVQAGLIEVYSHLKRHGFYWGLEFRREDAMHFEVSGNKVREWIRTGILP